MHNKKRAKRQNKQLNIRISPDLLYRLKRAQVDHLQGGGHSYIKDMVVDFIERGLDREESSHGAP